MGADRVVGGRYRLGGKLGSGGMGTVWHAYDERLHREVAVKEIRVPASESSDVRADLNRRAMLEARSAARLNHPNIVSVHDVLVDSDETWIVMTLVNGRSLHQAVLAQGRLDPGQAARIGLGLLDALDAAHAAGILHRDVKPSNVLLPDTGGVLLTDFSIAALSDAATVTGNSLLLGTPGYVAPERVTSGRSGPPADLFGLGATLYFATEAHGPFDRADPLAQLFATVNDAPPPPAYAGPLGEIVGGLLVKDPDRRWTSAHARPALEAIASGRALAPSPSPSSTGNLPRVPTGGPPTPFTGNLPRVPTGGLPRVPTWDLPTESVPDGTTVPGGRAAAVVPPGEPGRSRHRLFLVGLVVLALLASGAAVTWRLTNPPGGQAIATDPPTGGSSTQTTPTATASDGASPSPDPTASTSPSAGPVATATKPKPVVTTPPVIGTATFATAGTGMAWVTLPFWNAAAGRWEEFYGGVESSLQPGVRKFVHESNTPATLGHSGLSHPDIATVPLPGTHQPMAIVASNGTYYLYYLQFAIGGNSRSGVYLATSTDMENWQLRGMVISGDTYMYGGFDVVQYGATWFAFAASSAGTTMRTSTDLLTWSAPTSTGIPATRVTGAFSYGGAYYLAGQVTTAGAVDLIRAANPMSFATGAHIRIQPPVVPPGKEGPVGHIALGPSGQPYGFGDSGWFAPLSWTV